MDLIQKKAKVNIESVSKDDLQKLLNFSDQKTSSTKTKTSLKTKAKKVEKVNNRYKFLIDSYERSFRYLLEHIDTNGN